MKPMNEYCGLTDHNCTDVRGLAERLGVQFMPVDAVVKDFPEVCVWKEMGATHVGIQDGKMRPAILKS